MHSTFHNINPCSKGSQSDGGSVLTRVTVQKSIDVHNDLLSREMRPTHIR